jgi:glutaredoxin 3
MKKIVIYTASYCPHCVRAKDLLKRKGYDFEEIDVTDPNTRSDMIEKSNGRKTVPQIFIGETHIGGCDDLYALDSAGKLNEMVERD